MGTPQGQSSANTLTALNQVRHETRKDAHHYQRVVPAILGIIAPGNPLDQRRFGADFLAEAFSSPQLPSEGKQNLALRAIDLLRQYLDVPGEDAAVIKSVVQAATSIYPLVLKHVIYNPTDTATWMHMSAIKSNILRRMDSAPSSVKVSCVKFIQRVVQVQTPGQIADPRRPEMNEVSLALVPATHPIIAPSTLEPEALGLLDRLLSVFQEEQSDALLITATLNCIGILIRMRPAISGRILNAILRFNPFTLADKPLTPRTRVMMKSIERTVRAFFMNLIKRAPGHPLQPRIQAHLEQMQQRRAEMFDDSRKRSAPVEPTDGLDDAKRRRLDAPISTPTPPMFGSQQGPIPLARLFTLAQEPNQIIDIANFNLAPQVTNQIVTGLLHSIDRTRLDAAVSTVRARWLSVTQATQSSSSAPPGPPVQQPIASTDGTLNQIQHVPSPELPALEPAELNLGPLEIPQPPALSAMQVAYHSKETLDRQLSLLATSSAPQKRPHGFSRLSPRDAITTIVRLATRPTAGLASSSDPSIKSEYPTQDRHQGYSMSEQIRESLVNYILHDFRSRIDAAITWLNEEWYTERLASPGSKKTPRTEALALRLLTQLFSYLSAKDAKILIRLLSEMQVLTPAIIDRVRRLANDPEKVSMSIMALQYLILVRKGVRETCLDAIEQLWRDEDAAKAKCRDILVKWRPHVVQEAEPTKPEEGSGASNVKAEGLEQGIEVKAAA